MSDDHVIERWRRPIEYLAVSDATDHATDAAGRMTLDVRKRLTEESVERIRHGYVCIQCDEPHQYPFPELCSLCKFPMRTMQADEFERKFKGLEHDPRAVLIEKELDNVDDKHERNFYVTNHGIVVPRSIIPNGR